MTIDELTIIFKSQLDANEPILHYLIEKHLGTNVQGTITRTADIHTIESSKLDELAVLLEGLEYYTDDPYPGFTQYETPPLIEDLVIQDVIIK